MLQSKAEEGAELCNVVIDEPSVPGDAVETDNRFTAR